MMASPDRPDRLSHQNVRAILAAYFDSYNGTPKSPKFPWLVDPNRVEIGVIMPLFHTQGCLCTHTIAEHHKKAGPCAICTCYQYHDTIAFAGRLDLLGRVREDPDVFCPVDHKSTGKIDARMIQQYKLDSQLSGYLWATGQLTERPAHHLVAFINAIELALLPSAERKCPTHGVHYTECGPAHAKFQIIGPIERTAGQIDEWKRTAVKLALTYRRSLTWDVDSIHKVDTRGTFNGTCGYCEFREWCLADRPAKQVPKMFVHDGWDIYRHVRPSYDPPPEPNVFYVDNSVLKATAGCSTQALMRYGLGYTGPEQSAPLLAGLSVHAALEAWNRGATVEASLAAFDTAYLPPERESA